MTHTDPPPPKATAGQGPTPPSPQAAGAHPHDPSLLHNDEVAHEHSDVNARTILMYAVGLLVVGLIVNVLMWVVFAILERQAAANDPQLSPLAAPATEMPRTTRESPFFGAASGPQLLTNEPAALLKQRSTEEERLHNYGWVNQKTGVAHMPIDEAKKRLLERGLPTREGDPLPPSLGTREPAMGEASGGRTVPNGRPAAAPAPGTEPPPPESDKPGTGQPGTQPPAPAPKPHGQ